MSDPAEIDQALTVAIQAGGKSTRMGRDKSFVLFQGRPMIEIIKEKVANLGSETIIISNNPEPYSYLELPIYSDIYPEMGPLGGILTALKVADNDHLLVVACDMPWLNRDLLKYQISLKETADVIVPRWDKYPEPLHAVYSEGCISPIEQRIKAQKLKITGFFANVSVRFLDREEIVQFDPQGRSFTNVNKPEDLK